MWSTQRRPGKASRAKGPDSFIAELGAHLLALNVLNRYGGDCACTAEALHAAVTEVVTWLEEFMAKPLAQQWIMSTRPAGDCLRHLGHCVGEWGSAVSDPRRFATQIPLRGQFVGEALTEWQTATGPKRSRKLMIKYLTARLDAKNQLMTTPAASSRDGDETADFTNM